MLQNADVPSMMDEVARSLRRSARLARPTGVIVLHGVPQDPYGIEDLRRMAHVAVDLPSGSARPVIGSVIRFAKRVFRRSVRWYAQPIATKQSEVNLSLLDVTEKMASALAAQRQAIKDLEAHIEDLEELTDRLSRSRDGGHPTPPGREVAS